jgi:hypothetical protein
MVQEAVEDGPGCRDVAEELAPVFYSDIRLSSAT